MDYWISIQHRRGWCRQIRTADFNADLNCDENAFLRILQIQSSALPRKMSKIMVIATVPQTDTGGLVENTKANG